MLNFIAHFLLILGLAQSSFGWAVETPIVQFHTDKPLQQVHPQHDLWRLEFLVNHADGSPVPKARLHIQLSAPATHPLFSTDFPIVEGSPLIDSEVLAENGRFALEFVPPIRGTYRLQLDVAPEPGDESFLPIHKEWAPKISENPLKIRNLSILLGILVLIGGVSGIVLGRSGHRRSTAPTLIPLLLLCALFSSMTPRAEAHGDEHQSTTAAPAALIATPGVGGESVELKMLTEQVRVGELAEISSSLRDASGTIIPARFQLRFVQLEHDIVVFNTEVAVPDGTLHWKGQFYDGSNHRIEVDAVPLKESFAKAIAAQAEMEIAVEAIAPPPQAVIKSFSFLLLVTASAMLFGFFFGRIGYHREESSI